MNRVLVQLTSMLVIVAIMVLQLIWMLKHPDKWRWAVPIFLWVVHSFVFYASVFTTEWSHTDWSAILRMHGYISVLTIEAARMRHDSKRYKGK